MTKRTTLNQLTSRTDGMTTTTYTYDNNGNLTSKADGATTYTYSWNYENKMTSVTLPNSSVTTFAYNPDGLRIKKEDSSGTTKYVLDGQGKGQGKGQIFIIDKCFSDTVLTKKLGETGTAPYF